MIVPHFKKIRFEDGKTKMSLPELDAWIKRHVPKGAKNISLQLGETFDERFRGFIVALEVYWEEDKK